MLYVVGGGPESYNTAQKFNLTDGTWVNVSDTQKSRL